MKINVKANELVAADIDFVSLVEKGANRSPFKIVKSEDAMSKASTLGAKISKFFSPAGDKAISAVCVRKSAAKKVFPLLKEQGYKVEDGAIFKTDDIFILTQEGFSTDDIGSLIALNDDVAVATKDVIKAFDPWPMSKDFDENVSAASFYPGFYGAMDSLSDTVHSILHGSDDPKEAQESIDKATKSFSAYVSELISSLPTTVFKMEKELSTLFEGSTVVDTELPGTESQPEITKGEAMNTTDIKEAAAGDLDGLMDDVSKADKESTAEVVINVVKDEAPAEEVVTPEATAEAATETPAEVTKDEAKPAEGEAATPAEEATPADDAVSKEDKLIEAVTLLAKSVVELKETVTKQGEKIEAIDQKADTAVTKSDSVVAVRSSMSDLNSSLQTLSGANADVTKSEESDDIWAGLLPAFDIQNRLK